MSQNYTTTQQQGNEEFGQELPYKRAARILKDYLEMSPKIRAHNKKCGAFKWAYELVSRFPYTQIPSLFGENLVKLVDEAEVEN